MLPIRPVAPVLVGLALLVVAGCSSRNAMGRSQVTLLPAAVMNSQAAAAFDQEKKQKPLSRDARRLALVQRVGQRLIAQAQAHYGAYCQGFQWEVQLFEAPGTVNAYCMPGGKIGFYSGILAPAANEAGLAVVMGHEIAHALLQHGNARASQQLGVAAVASMAEAALGRSGSLAPRTREAILTAVGMGAQFGVVLPNSRYDENEADHLGLRLMALAGYDPGEAPRFWTRMSAGSGGANPEWMSTHPADDRRVKRLGEFMPEVLPLYQAAGSLHGLGESL